MKYFSIILLVFSLCFLMPKKAEAFFWLYYSPRIKGNVVDGSSNKPLAGVKLSYEVYRGVGTNHSRSFRLFRQVESVTAEDGSYQLPAVFKTYWLLMPNKILACCFIPGIGLHAGFSASDVTIRKTGYRSQVISKQRLSKRPRIYLWPL